MADAFDVIVIGAGFIGAEVASTCLGLGCQVTVLEAMEVPLEASPLGHRLRHAEGHRNRSAGVARAKGVVDAFGRVEEGRRLHRRLEA